MTIKNYILLLVLIITYSIQIHTQSIAETLNFNTVLEKSIQNSFDLKIADVTLGISKTELKEVKSEYYPQLRLGYNNEYSRNFADDDSFASIGDYTLNQNTRFQNLIYTSLSYNLFDFGARGKKLAIAKSDISQKEFSYNQQLRDLKIDILDLYTKALLSYKEIEKQKNISDLFKQLFEAKERLYEAGETSKLDIMEEAINIARSIDKQDKSTHTLQNALKELSFYTFDAYNAHDLAMDNIVNFEAFDNPEKANNKKEEIDKTLYSIPEFNPDFVLETQIYNLEIDKKQDELKLVKKERLPKFEFYTKYLFYGSDESNPIESFTNIRSRNVAVGLSIGMPLFDGFKNRAQQEKLKLEVEKLKLERDKKIFELKKQYDILNQDAKSYKQEFENQITILKEYKQQLNALKRLTENKLTEKTELLRKETELIEQIYNLEISLINTYSALKKLEFLSEGTP